MIHAETVSIVIPAYNAESYIAEAIESCLAQTHCPSEIIVVDDGSTDNTASVVRSFGEPVRIVRQRNRGEGGARNCGIDEARGHWVAFLDADDRWEPEKLERQLQACNDPHVVACHTNFVNFGAQTEPFDGRSVPEPIRYSPFHIAVFAPILPSSLLVRRDLPIRFPDSIDAAVDVIYCLELIAYGQIVLVPNFLVHYRRHPRSMTADVSFAIRAHNNLLAWLEQHRTAMSEQDYRLTYNGLLQALVDRADRARWCREWSEHDTLKYFLRRYEAEPVVSRFMRRARLPKMLYLMKDVMCRRFSALPFAAGGAQ